MKKEITVNSNLVFEARPLAELVALAGNYSGKITITMDEKTINAKSIMGVMGLGLDMGKKSVVEADGEDAKEAIAAIENFLSK